MAVPGARGHSGARKAEMCRLQGPQLRVWVYNFYLEKLIHVYEETVPRISGQQYLKCKKEVSDTAAVTSARVKWTATLDIMPQLKY